MCGSPHLAFSPGHSHRQIFACSFWYTYCKQSKTGNGSGLGMRLVFTQCTYVKLGAQNQTDMLECNGWLSSSTEQCSTELTRSPSNRGAQAHGRLHNVNSDTQRDKVLTLLHTKMRNGLQCHVCLYLGHHLCFLLVFQIPSPRV